MATSSTTRSRALVELKVIAATAAAGVAGVGVTVLNQAVADEALLAPVPTWGQTLITMLAPPLLAFLAGWSARHTPRPDLDAVDPAPPAPTTPGA
ncbi:holin [Actinacidiphila epipremni]|uniref:Holin n=1 Tax=Actinacidiphila epipremni TaxID=2053013 RepID=A0ABX0ZKT9_9ACTN|nr:holin [Actinacidiphila epipremni]NJP42263.1 holin [Actinacidiphila epipremni]